MKVKFFITGGTICKRYNEISGALEFRDSFIPGMLERGRCKLDYSTEQLMLKDSLEMNDEDRATILASCSACEESKIIISHGTDTMVDTARVLGQKLEHKTVVLFGAMIPYSISNSDAIFNLGCAVTAVQLLGAGVFVVMNGHIFRWDDVSKNRGEGVFQRADS
ncbi:MAG: asparaginase [Zetaproteobacteria bacterium CG12_big_fil_rev_8_21_14_0_65_54_13]|nr:MAG: asparaginase [Zetaproteobacteria bacterium CG12_big_fil_rev_8_21_14_0_65_54_13]PIX54303.1 MAG: asparaginase [Zetaproteobacteria bacterium CG_4_10_14_3_um_filter_54_28]PJA28000.1 MAG: asparaginase [Zetaproteobacteria bacterium CG_4_9_14_3_um_filter_54_145]